MQRLQLSMDRADFQQEWKELELDLRVKLALLLESVGVETVAYMRSLTNQMRPGVRGGGPRRAHPGGWADDSGQLVNSYYFAVLVGGQRITWSDPSETEGSMQPLAIRGRVPSKLPPGDLQLELGNTAEYSIYLERRDGFWVITGVTEAGGELETALRRIGQNLGFEIR